MKPARLLLDAAVTLRAVAQSLESTGAATWTDLDAAAARVMLAADTLLAVRDATAGAPEPPPRRRAHLVALPTPSDSRRRYFLHGDRRASGEFYCALCDLFMPRDHFDHPMHGSPADHARRLDASRLTMRRLLEVGRPVFRPADAENLFDALDATHGASHPAPHDGGGKRA